MLITFLKSYFSYLRDKVVSPLDLDIAKKETEVNSVKNMIANQEKVVRKMDTELKRLRVEQRKIIAEHDKKKQVGLIYTFSQ